MINSPDVEIAINLSYVQCFPVRNGCDVFPPWITPLVKYLLKKKNRAADKGHFHKVEDLSSMIGIHLMIRIVTMLGFLQCIFRKPLIM